ncbi:Acg family FMN-binding oxidoreductase [Streptomyces litchfieldiae]|uniref:Nitroreductase family protein n=1 Tax=Streptomyces litchfieldiae TaxID=3075543 RepID=A0ABU2MU89_9ACTN|nr:nitroreductase family protein [Streptomyces sp. DSM 44938]MDT0345213.1 nitroreductase family protein [Streptomyces sp. DSM 44938]
MPTDKPRPQTVTALVRAATAAPSLHNAQPWRFRYTRDSALFQIRAALDRCLPHSDPHGRALHMGCGAALLNLRVAAAHAGWRPVTRLLPDPHDPRLLATVRLERADGDPDLAALHPAIRRRRTSRLPFSEKRVADPVRAALREAAESEGAQLHYPSAWHVRTVLDLVHDAEGRDHADPGRAAELAEWTDPERTPDGHDFAGRMTPAERTPGESPFEQEPQLALLGTAEDRPTDWLRAGQAMERVLLVATRRGVSAGLSSAPVDWSDARWADRDPMSPMGQVHVVLRLGYGPRAPATPRRPVAQVLQVE